MPVTLPGWILFAVMLATTGTSAFMSTRILLCACDRRCAPKPPRYLITALAFGAVMVASALLFILVEPKPA